MPDIPIQLKQIVAADGAALLQLSAAAGWNQTEADWLFLINHPENKCIAATGDNKIIATTTAITFENQLAWIGMVLVQESYRRKGIGKLVLNKVLEQLESFPSVKLDATAIGQPLYEQLGFKEEYRIVRMINHSATPLYQPDHHEGLVEITTGLIPEIVSVDEKIYGVRRQSLLQYLFNNSPDIAFAGYQQNKFKGFILGRRGRLFHQLGPIEASDLTLVKNLLNRTLTVLNGKPVIIDVPCKQEEIIGLLTDHGFTVQRYFTRMYKGSNGLQAETDILYAIAGPEFG